MEVQNVKEYESDLYAKLESENQNLLDRFESGYFEQSDIDELESVLKEMQR